MALRNAFGELGLDTTLQAIRDRLPAALGGNGGIKVEQQGSLPAGTNNIGKVDVNSLPANQSVNTAQVAGTAVDTNSGVKSAGTQRIVLATDQPQLTNALKVDGSAVTQPTSEKPSAAGGAVILYTGSIGNTATSVKGAAGQMYSYLFTNNNSSVSYVQFFNLAAGSVTVGTTAPLFSFGMPANTAANVSFPGGIAFSAAITVACTTTRAGSASPANTVDLNIFGA